MFLLALLVGLLILASAVGIYAEPPRHPHAPDRQRDYDLRRR
jgi:hypothetical protein